MSDLERCGKNRVLASAGVVRASAVMLWLAGFFACAVLFLEGAEAAIMPQPPQTRPRHLDVGDRFPDFAWRDTQGRHVSLTQSAHAGRVSLVLVCPAGTGAGVQRELTKLRALEEKWRGLGLGVFAVTPAPPDENAVLKAKLELPFPLLSDAGFFAGQALDLAPATAKKNAGDCAVAVVDANQRLEKLIAPAGGGRQADRALKYCEKRGVQDSAAVNGQAPVLILPRVLDPDHCARLVRAFESGETFQGGVASSEHGGNVPLHKIKSRQDVALADTGPEARALFEIFRYRLFPEIKKVFNYRVTRAETLRLGCYEADSGGHFAAHRDDTTPYTAHRRFAMSINLNTGGYEGGRLSFPEYGPGLLSADTGAAIVFSCSLLHEVTRIDRGRRFVLLGFFYDESGQAIREKLLARGDEGRGSGS